MLFVESCDGPARPKVTRSDILLENCQRISIKTRRNIGYVPFSTRTPPEQSSPSSSLVSRLNVVGGTEENWSRVLSLWKEHQSVRYVPAGPIPLLCKSASVTRTATISLKFLLTNPQFLSSFITQHTSPKLVANVAAPESARLYLGIRKLVHLLSLFVGIDQLFYCPGNV